ELASRTWTSVFTTSVWRPYVTDLHIEGDNWFAGTSSGLLYSHDGGRSWQVQRNNGKEPITMVRSAGSRIAAPGYRTLLTSRDEAPNPPNIPSPPLSLLPRSILN